MHYLVAKGAAPSLDKQFTERVAVFRGITVTNRCELEAKRFRITYIIFLRGLP